MASSAGPCFFCVVGSNPTSTIINFFKLSPCRTWKIRSPVYPGNETAWIYWQVRPYIRPICYYPAVSGGGGVVRLSLGKLSLVNLLQVVKRTNTSLIPWHCTECTCIYTTLVCFVFSSSNTTTATSVGPWWLRFPTPSSEVRPYVLHILYWYFHPSTSVTSYWFTVSVLMMPHI